MVNMQPPSTLRVDVNITPHRYSGADTRLLAALVAFVVKRCATWEVSASRTSLRVNAMVPVAELTTVDAFMEHLKIDVQAECDRLRGVFEGRATERIERRLGCTWGEHLDTWEGRYRNEVRAPRAGVRIVHIAAGARVRGAQVALDHLGHTPEQVKDVGNGWRATFRGGSWILCVDVARLDSIRGLRADVVTYEIGNDLPESVDVGGSLLSEPWSLMKVIGIEPDAPPAPCSRTPRHVSAKLLTWRHDAVKAGDYEAFTDPEGNWFLIDGMTLAAIPRRAPTTSFESRRSASIWPMGAATKRPWWSS